MSTINNNDINTNEAPKRVAAIQQVLPDSPDYMEKYSTNAEDLQMTSKLDNSFEYKQREPRRSFHHQNLVVVGSHEKPITLGRGGACTIKIGRRNRNISRVHVSIAFNNDKQLFELTVVGLNGACVDSIQYDQHAVIPLDDESMVDVLGDCFRFKVPPPPSSLNFMERLQKQQQQVETTPELKKNNSFVFRELSPEAEPQEKQPKQQEEPKQQQEEQPKQEEEEEEVQVDVEQNEEIKPVVVEEEEDYPIELVPEDASSPVEKESSPEQEEEVYTNKQESTSSNILKERNDTFDDSHDYSEVIIDALVFSRTSSMPISDIYTRILKANPAYGKQSREIWIERIRSVLKEKPFFGEIKRKGKTADGSPVENLYYYNSDLDPVEWRRATYTQVGRSARKCTLKDKQYFWKIPPKLGRHRSSYIPPPAPKSRNDENVDPKKLK